MNRRTFELLAKWIAKEQKINIEFGEQGPCADVKNNRIMLPYDVKSANVFSALAWLMHEAAHLRYSKFPDTLAQGKIAHDILNVIEDIRIDNKNFGLLPNIKDFYGRMIKDHVYTKEEEIKKQDLLTRTMITAILTSEGFKGINDTEAEKAMSKHDVLKDLQDAQYAIERKDWKEVERIIQEIMKKFKVKEQKGEQNGMEIQIGERMGKGQDSNGNDKDDNTGIPGGNKQNGTESSNSPHSLGVEKYLHPASMWGKGHLEGASGAQLGPVALKDQTKENLKELLNIKEKRIVHDGVKLDTDNLTDFFTGEIENLFQDDDVIKRRKSKIVFLLDGSGSMSSDLLDNNPRRKVLVKCVKAMTEILDEIRQTEGLDVNYEVNAFENNLIKLKQEQWEQDYMKLSGGTNIIESFTSTQQDLLKDHEIDGKKLIIVLTDGDVHQSEIEAVRKEIIRHNEDVRCMFIGVGADIMGACVKDIVGDNNILMEEGADCVIMDVICAML